MQTGETLNGIITPLSGDPTLFFISEMLLCRLRICLSFNMAEQGNKYGWAKQAGCKVWVWSELPEALLCYLRTRHRILWSGVIWGNSQVRSWWPQRMSGIKVIALWMGAQSLQEIPNRGCLTLLKEPLKDKSGDGKMLLISQCFIWLIWSSKGFWRLDYSISTALCNGHQLYERMK